MKHKSDRAHYSHSIAHSSVFEAQGPVWLIPSVWQMSDYVRGDAIMGLMTIHHYRGGCHHHIVTTRSPTHHNIATHTLLPFSNFLEINSKHPLLGSLQHLTFNNQYHPLPQPYHTIYCIWFSCTSVHLCSSQQNNKHIQLPAVNSTLMKEFLVSETQAAMESVDKCLVWSLSSTTWKVRDGFS